jgi:hypothetical protein
MLRFSGVISKARVSPAGRERALSEAQGDLPRTLSSGAGYATTLYRQHLAQYTALR